MEGKKFFSRLLDCLVVAFLCRCCERKGFSREKLSCGRWLRDNWFNFHRFDAFSRKITSSWWKSPCFPQKIKNKRPLFCLNRIKGVPFNLISHFLAFIIVITIIAICNDTHEVDDEKGRWYCITACFKQREFWQVFFFLFKEGVQFAMCFRKKWWISRQAASLLWNDDICLEKEPGWIDSRD